MDSEFCSFSLQLSMSLLPHTHVESLSVFNLSYSCINIYLDFCDLWVYLGCLHKHRCMGYILENDQLTSDCTIEEKLLHHPLSIYCQQLLSEVASHELYFPPIIQLWCVQSCIGVHRCCESMSAMGVRYPEDSTSQHSFYALSLTFLLPLLLWCFLILGGTEHSTTTFQHYNKSWVSVLLLTENWGFSDQSWDQH